MSRTLFSGNGTGPQGQTGAIMRPLAAFSSEYVNDDYLKDVLTGFSAMVIARFRKPAADDDAYNKILKDCFGLPDELSSVLAQKIETYDVIGGGKDLEWYNSWIANISEGVRRLANWIPSVLHIPISNSQDQTYDIDFLYEMRNLGKVIDDLNARASLMSSQAMIVGQLGMFQTGDAYGDIEDAGDAELGDLVRLSRLRSMPANVVGNTGGIMNLGKAATKAKAEHVADGIGMVKHGRHAGKIGRQAKHPGMKKALDKVLSGNPATAFLLAALTGAGAGLLPGIISKIKGMRHQGDADMGDAYSTVKTMLGDDAATAWMAGDVDGLAKEFASLAADDHSTGDPDLDAAIEADMGDVEHEGDMTPEAGGLFHRIRVNVNRKMAGNRSRRQFKKGQKQIRKNRAATELAQSKDERSDMGPSWERMNSGQNDDSNDMGSSNDTSDMNEFEIPGG